MLDSNFSASIVNIHPLFNINKVLTLIKFSVSLFIDIFPFIMTCMISLGKKDSKFFVSRLVSTDNNLLTFYIAQDNYTGGAHGYYTRQYATIDLSHHRHLTFNDIIKTDKRRFVRLLLLHKMKEEYYKGRITETDNDYLLYLCGEEDIKRLFNDVNSQEALDYMIDNFPMYEPAITPYGLVFYYNPYDIDCFAGGNKLYIVTYKELKNCITKDYKISINNYYEE